MDGLERGLSRRGFLGAAGSVVGAASLGGLLAGCGGSSGGGSKSGKATLNVWMYSEPSRTAIQDNIIAAFKKANPDIDIKLTRTDFSTYYSKLATSIASRTLPDVFMMSGAYFYQAVQNKALMDLTDRIKTANISLDNYFGSPTGEDTVWENKVYGIPGEIDHVALAYNEDMFEAAGLDAPTAGWSWDQLLHAAQAMTKKNKNGKQQYGFYSWNSSQEVWGSFVRENGGNFLDSTYTKGALDQPEAIEAIQFAVDLIHKYKVSPAPLGISSLPGYIQSTGNPFLTGLIGMKVQGNYEMALLSQIKDFKWNVVEMPKKQKPGGIGWYQSWVMGSTTKHPDEAWKLLDFIVTQGQDITAKTPGRGLTPSLKSAAASPSFLQTGAPNMKAWTDGWKNHFDFAFHPAWLEYQGIYSKALDACFNTNANVADAMKSATSQVNNSLSRYPWFDSSKLSPIAWS
ncbi:MAG: multiple sugar transport system substrate-binding protein [Pseudonocardiales bacterium]|jgi:multiple sugar transport system substrate-binding protein|nr:multiple sugar transport system substrate-binding protein [Pseudonocardiales bacterium]